MTSSPTLHCQHPGEDRVIQERLLVCFTEQDSSLPSSYPGIDCLPAGLSRGAAFLFLQLGRTGFIRTLMSHTFCAFQCFIPAGWILVSPFTLGLLMLHAYFVGLFLGLLKQIELFGSWSEWCSDRGRGKKERKKNLKDWGIFL